MNSIATQESLPPPEGELVAGKYEVVRRIGQGAMGAVWEGRHVSLGTRVACKFIDADFARKSSEARSRFRNEAKAAAALRSKHVVDVYDYGLMTDGRPYIVMEFLEGESLEERLARLGRLPLGTTIRIVTQVSRALHKAHRQGIIHRDLKPDNIFLVWDDEDETDQVKVVDFGIAKFTDDKVEVSHATQAGSVLGTPFFMSPEQARGTTDVDLRSDLWALGVVTFQCLTGQLPFYSDAVGDLLVRICTGEIPVPSHIAPDLPLSIDAWMARALERDRDLRFQSAKEMTDRLGEVLGPEARPFLESQVEEQTGDFRRPGFTTRHATAGPQVGKELTAAPRLDAAGAQTVALETTPPESEELPPVIPQRRPALRFAVGVALIAAAGLGAAVGLSSGLLSQTDPSRAQKEGAEKNSAATSEAIDREGSMQAENRAEENRTPSDSQNSDSEKSGEAIPSPKESLTKTPDALSDEVDQPAVNSKVAERQPSAPAQAPPAPHQQKAAPPAPKTPPPSPKSKAPKVSASGSAEYPAPSNGQKSHSNEQSTPQGSTSDDMAIGLGY